VCGNWQLRATVLSRFGLPLMIDRKNPFSLTITQKHTLRFSPKIFVPTLNISRCHWILRTSLDVLKLLIVIFSLSQCSGRIQTFYLRIMSQVFDHCANIKVSYHFSVIIDGSIEVAFHRTNVPFRDFDFRVNSAFRLVAVLVSG